MNKKDRYMVIVRTTKDGPALVYFFEWSYEATQCYTMQNRIHRDAQITIMMLSQGVWKEIV